MRKYEDLRILQENRLKPRAYYIPEGQGIFQNLNGTWNFDFYQRDDDPLPQRSAPIDVPSCWQCRGYEAPYYSNVCFPFPCDPPYVPMDNPMGVYTRSFVVENMDRQHYVVFEGVSSFLELLINGQYVGCSQGSRLQAEFEITDFVKPGENQITARVYKWCFGSYLEDQDCFRYNGIFRDVYLLSRPLGHVRDVEVYTEGDRVDVKLEGNAHLRLLNPQGLCVAEADAEDGRHTRLTVSNPVRWNAEQPKLYQLVVSSCEETIRISVGFVEYSINDRGAFTVNGKEVKLKGVNHHDTHPTNGYTMTDEEMLLDLKQMKRLNINCIRTSHYPPHPKFLEMCNQLGLYVMLETDLESHGFASRKDLGMGYDVVTHAEDWPGNRAEWLPAFMERMQRAYHRDKNNPCIFSWSTGNESGHCNAHVEIIKWLRQTDPRRLVHCEDATRASRNPGPEGIPEARTRPHLYSMMYPRIQDMEKYAQDPTETMPYFMCEYSHAMGNGPGEIADVWDLCYKYPKLIGGCIWEWADHTFLVDGVPRYGGDFGELTHDGNFCCDGLVSYDRKFKAGSYNVKYVYQYVSFRLTTEGVEITNRFSFTNLNVYQMELDVVVDGKTVTSRTFRLDLEPGQSAVVPFEMPESCTLGAYVVCRGVDAAGEVAALWESSLRVDVKTACKCFDGAAISEDDRRYMVTGKNFAYEISKHTALPVHMLKNGQEQLAAPVTMSVWRAPTDNDRKVCLRWGHPSARKGENYDRIFNHVYTCSRENGMLCFTGSLSGISREPFLHYTLTYRFASDGEMELEIGCNVRTDCFWLPRFGFDFHLAAQSNAFRYYGQGPAENYEDMNAHVTTGWFESDMDQEYWPYIHPQEHGNHCCCRRLIVPGSLEFASEKNFQMQVSRYTAENLTAAGHIDHLQPNGAMNVRIDYRNSGLGSSSCGPDIQPKYTLREKSFRFQFSVK